MPRTKNFVLLKSFQSGSFDEKLMPPVLVALCALVHFVHLVVYPNGSLIGCVDVFF